MKNMRTIESLTAAYPAINYVVVCIVVLAIVIFIRSLTENAAPKYKKQILLTPNEAEFFGRLRHALPDYFVFPQVAMSALIAPDLQRTSKRYWAAFSQISQKRVDFVICARSLTVVCIVELDDKTHDARKDEKRDRLTMSAGIKTIRWQSRSKPSEVEIKAAIIGMINTTEAHIVAKI